MNPYRALPRLTFGGLAIALAAGISLLGSGAVSADAQEDRYQQRNLVSDGFVPADHMDPNLVNAWGIAFSAPAVGA